MKRITCPRCKEADAKWMCRVCLDWFCQHICTDKISARVATCDNCKRSPK